MPPRPRGKRSAEGLSNRKRATRERKKKRAKAKSGPVAPPGVWHSPASSDLSSESENLEEKSSLSPLKKVRRADDASQTAPTSITPTSASTRFIPRAARAPHFRTSPTTCVCGGSNVECPFRPSLGFLAPRPKSRVVSLTAPASQASNNVSAASTPPAGSATTSTSYTDRLPNSRASSSSGAVAETGVAAIPPRREDRFSLYRARIKARLEESQRWETSTAGSEQGLGR
jgi:hypothetical protein